MSVSRLDLFVPMKSRTTLITAIWSLITHVAMAVHMVPLSIPQLTDKAQLVLHGNVTSRSVQRDPQGRIYTRVELAVSGVWKGEQTLKSFVVVQSGGVLGEESVTVDGQEDFTIGEEVVLFLVLNQRGEGLVIGLAQGKFKVARDSNGEKTVHNRFHGLAPGREKNASGNEDRERLPLAALKARVQGGAQ
jgi:hypothetical protein